MVYSETEIKDKLELLAELQIEKGVQPEELAANIRNDSYTEITMKRVFGKVKCTVSFNDTDLFDETKTKYQYIYIYNADSVLQEIQIKNNGKTFNMWSRKDEVVNLVNEITDFIRKNQNEKAVNKFIGTLPDSIIKTLNDTALLVI